MKEYGLKIQICPTPDEPEKRENIRMKNLERLTLDASVSRYRPGDDLMAFLKDL